MMLESKKMLIFRASKGQLNFTGKSLKEALIFASTNPQYYTTNQTQFGYSECRGILCDGLKYFFQIHIGINLNLSRKHLLSRVTFVRKPTRMPIRPSNTISNNKKNSRPAENIKLFCDWLK